MANVYGQSEEPVESDPSIPDLLLGLDESEQPDDGLAHIEPHKPNTTLPVSEIFVIDLFLRISEILLYAHKKKYIFQSQANRIREAGYPAEVHTIQTNDGYILKMLRIPHGINKKVSEIFRARKPVFLMHPFLESSHAYIVQGPGKALG